MKDSFIFQLYRDFKLLFVVVLGLVFGTLWFALKSREEFPFLLFGMYSLKEDGQNEYTAYSIVMGEKELVYNDMKDAEQELIETSLGNAAALKGDPLKTTGFANWLKKYTNKRGPLEIYKLTCLYTEDGKPLIRKRELIYRND